MPMRIEIIDIFPAGPLDTFASVTVTVQCVNETGRPVQVDHLQTRVFLEVRAHADGELLLVIDDALRRRMLFSAGLADPPQPLTIAPGAREEIAFDLSNYYYPLMAGVYRLDPCFESTESGRVTGQGWDLQVIARTPAHILEWYENPVFGTHSLLCNCVEKNGDHHAYMRWLGLNRPLASFFNKPIEMGLREATPIPCIPAFFGIESFKPGFEKVIIWQTTGDKAIIRKYKNGNPTGEPIPCFLPESTRLLPNSFRLEDGTVFVFALKEKTKTRVLKGFRVDPGGRTSVCLEQAVERAVGLIAVGGGADTIHLISAGPLLTHTLFSHEGGLVAKTDIGTFGGTPQYLSVDLPGDCIKAAYLDSDDRRLVTTVESPFPSIKEPIIQPRVAQARLAVGRNDKFREMDFLFDFEFRLNILYSTMQGHLLIYNSILGFTRLASGEPAYFPRLLPGSAPGQEGSTLPFIGFYMGSRGYRFYEPGALKPWRHLRAMRI